MEDESFPACGSNKQEQILFWLGTSPLDTFYQSFRVLGGNKLIIPGEGVKKSDEIELWQIRIEIFEIQIHPMDISSKMDHI